MELIRINLKKGLELTGLEDYEISTNITNIFLKKEYRNKYSILIQNGENTPKRYIECLLTKHQLENLIID